MNSLAKYLALQYIQRYIAEFNEIECCSSQYSGKIGHTDHEANQGGSAVPHDKAVAIGSLPSTGGLSANPVHRVGEEKLREENR